MSSSFPSASGSAWAKTPSFFAQYMEALPEACDTDIHLIAGAADGKFVLPLIRRGYRVVAVERDDRYVDGTHPVLVEDHRQGLSERVAAVDRLGTAEVLTADYMELAHYSGRFASVFTSCSWHYSCNAAHELGDMVRKLQSFVRAGGILAADFMLEMGDETPKNSRYPTLEEVLVLFTEWDIRLALETRAFPEPAHIDNPVDHEHRMGFVLAVHSSHDLGVTPR